MNHRFIALFFHLALATVSASHAGEFQKTPAATENQTENAIKLSNAIAQNLRLNEVLNGDFEQTKTLKGFKNPLRSRGNFIIAKSHGIWWNTREPFASTLLLTSEKLKIKQADGGAGTSIKASEGAAFETINNLLFSLLRGDLKNLATQFAITGELTGKKSWQLRLTPENSALKLVFKHIDLIGDDYVRQITLYEERGDITRIDFSSLQHTTALRTEDKVHFE